VSPVNELSVATKESKEGIQTHQNSPKHSGIEYVDKMIVLNPTPKLEMTL
jgi:hypothetical protein